MVEWLSMEVILLENEERFWTRIKAGYIEQMHGNKIDCWPWLAGTNSNGYGMFNWCLGQDDNGRKYYRNILAHRLSYMLKCGNIPEDAFILHRCNNRLCINPDHLYVGTAQDNADDLKKFRANKKKNEQLIAQARYMFEQRRLRDEESCGSY